MRPRPALLLGALIAPALPLLAAAPAHAATTIICVNRPGDTECESPQQPTIAAALSRAATDGTDSVIRVGTGTYTGPFVFPAGPASEALTVQGEGNGTGDNATVFTAPAGQTVVTATGATVRNIRVVLSGSGSTGVDVSGNGIIQRVIVADTQPAPASNAVGMLVQQSTVVESTVSLNRGTGNTGIWQVTGTSSLPRAKFNVTGTALVVEGGSVGIDNSVIELARANDIGLRAGTLDSGGAATIDAKHVTIDGVSGARAALASANHAAVTSTVAVTNSIVRGAPLAADETAGTALVTVAYSDYEIGADVVTGTGEVDPGDGNLDVDPRFIRPSADNYGLAAGSPVVDRGSLVYAVGPDKDGGTRVVDGDRNGQALPDMGAFELRDLTPPKTTFISGPSGPTNNRTPVFQFRSGDAESFECRIDLGAWQACQSPTTTAPLAEGAHSFQVRAVDEVLNVEDPPATRSFTVDTVAPNARITKKPAKRFFKQRVKFKFAASEPGVRYQCKLDNRGWRPCPATWRFNTKVGKHRLLVRAVDAAGNLDRSPARYKYKRLKRGR